MITILVCNIELIIPPDNLTAIYYCDLIILIACALIIYTSPLNIHSLYKKHLKRLPNKLFLTVSLLLVFLLLLSVFFTIPYINNIVTIVMILSVIYSFVIGYFDEKKSIRKTLKKSMILWIISLMLFVLSVIFDFSDYIQKMDLILSEDFNYLPLFYIILNIGLIYKLKTLAQSIPKEVQSKLSGFKLTKRELEVVSLLMAGKNSSELSSSLSISVSTVKKHISKIYKKTNTQNIAGFISLLNK